MDSNRKCLIVLFRDQLCESPCHLAQHCPKDNIILTFISIVVACPIASFPLIDHDPERLAEVDKMAHPFLRLMVSLVALVAKCGIDPL